jgi:hypothetical protein
MSSSTCPLFHYFIKDMCVRRNFGYILMEIGKFSDSRYGFLMQMAEQIELDLVGPKKIGHIIIDVEYI